jgi:signal transduction histidine kinase
MSTPEANQPEVNLSLDKLRRENQELREQLKLVEQERIEYLQNVSHQIVAPLSAMKWHIENVTEMRVSIDRAKKVLRSVYSQATLAVHLAKNFRLMSNLESDHALSTLREPLQEVELRRLLVNLADDFQPLGWDQDLSIAVDDDNFDDGPPVLAIKPLISQVFSNILENAVKYSNRAASIVATGKHQPQSGTFAVEIRNRGIPLRPEDTRRVFERTYRSEDAKRRYPAGTGFGLYIARRIVEIHEGSIDARTDPNGSTVFRVVLSVSGLQGKARTRD